MVWEGFPYLRESETTIKIKFVFFRGGLAGGREENCPKCYFSWEAPRQYNFESENFIVEKVCCHGAGSYYRQPLFETPELF